MKKRHKGQKSPPKRLLRTLREHRRLRHAATSLSGTPGEPIVWLPRVFRAEASADIKPLSDRHFEQRIHERHNLTPPRRRR